MDPRRLCPWGFSRQEYWSGLPLLQKIFLTKGLNQFFKSPALADGFFTTSALRGFGTPQSDCTWATAASGQGTEAGLRLGGPAWVSSLRAGQFRQEQAGTLERFTHSFFHSTYLNNMFFVCFF